MNVAITEDDYLFGAEAAASPTATTNHSVVVEDEGDIYLNHCHHDYYDEDMTEQVDEDDAIAMYNQFFQQQAKLTRDLHLENAKKRIAEQAMISGNTTSSTTSLSSEEEHSLEDGADLSCEPNKPGVYSIGTKLVKVPLKERCNEHGDSKEDDIVESSSSPKSPSRKKQKESSTTSEEKHS